MVVVWRNKLLLSQSNWHVAYFVDLNLFNSFCIDRFFFLDDVTGFEITFLLEVSYYHYYFCSDSYAFQCLFFCSSFWPFEGKWLDTLFIEIEACQLFLITHSPFITMEDAEWDVPMVEWVGQLNQICSLKKQTLTILSHCFSHLKSGYLIIYWFICKSLSCSSRNHSVSFSRGLLQCPSYFGYLRQLPNLFWKIFWS